jgi:amino-acid N-acetyltransferase
MNDKPSRWSGLREILRYVPRFRERVFVIAVDGALVEHDNFGTLLVDIALLRSLRVGVVLVHGASHQIRRLAAQAGQNPSDFDGTGVTDAATLQLALNAANRVTHEILEGLAANDLRGACGNALVSHPAGILHGVDHQFTGRIERVDTDMLRSLLTHDIIPVVPPLGCDGDGQTYRLNSDHVAVELARTLEAVKLIYLTTHPGIRLGEQLLRQLSLDEAETILKKQRNEVAVETLSKLEWAVKAARDGVQRVHIIDGRTEEALLAEVFSNQGVGTLIHANEYKAIRKAHKKDARAIHALIQHSVENEELLPRSRAEIERQIDDYYVFEVDRNPVACAALHQYPETKQAEVACVCVDPRFEHQGIGAKLVAFVEARARQLAVAQLLCLTTQAFNYFVRKCGYSPGTPDNLPPSRRERYDKSGRRSRVLIKALTPSTP